MNASQSLPVPDAANAAPPTVGAGPRMPFEQMPERLRSIVVEWLGAPVVTAESQVGGFSPGPATRVVGANGARLFVKAVGAALNPDAPHFHRREALVAAALPEGMPTPRLRHVHDEGDAADAWIMLAYDDVEGRQPPLPWQSQHLQQFVEAMADVAAALTPPPDALAAVVGRVSDWSVMTDPVWQHLCDAPPAGLDAWSRVHAAQITTLAARAPELLGNGPQTLVHCDLRADNVLLSDDGRMLLVDWPHARIGPAWLDLLLAAPSVALQGGPPPGDLLARHPATAGADPDAITAALACVVGFFTHGSLQPPPPGLPTLRGFQAAQGRVARAWLAERMGLPAPNDADVERA